jgi:hypothetical protein
MIARTVSEALESWIEEQGGALINALSIYIAGDSNDIIPPCIVIDEGSEEEHEILEEVYTVDLTVSLKTIPRDDDGSTTAEHFEMCAQLRDCLNRRDEMITFMNNLPTLYAYDARGMESKTLEAEDTRETQYTINIVALQKHTL